MAGRFIVERFLFVLVAFIGIVLLVHTLIIKTFQDGFFVDYLTASCTSGVLLLTGLYILAKFNKNLEKQVGNFLYFKGKHHYKALLKEAITDGLTGLYDHKYFKLRLEEELERSKRYLRPLSLLMVDVDHFKEYNDTHGHIDGDEVLINLAEIFKRFTRKVDIIARYGGEEFAIVLPETKREGAGVLAERLRKAVASTELKDDRKITVSIGIGFFDGADVAFGSGLFTRAKANFTKEDFIKMADKALYKAKTNGRNRVEA